VPQSAVTISVAQPHRREGHHDGAERTEPACVQRSSAYAVDVVVAMDQDGFTAIDRASDPLDGHCHVHETERIVQLFQSRLEIQSGGIRIGMAAQDEQTAERLGEFQRFAQTGDGGSVRFAARDPDPAERRQPRFATSILAGGWRHAIDGHGGVHQGIQGSGHRVGPVRPTGAPRRLAACTVSPGRG
jgi:hypothetical protein